MKVEPQISQRAFHPNANVFGCQSRPMDGSQGPRCYQPSQIQNAYNITPLLNAGKDGTGRTIVIIDAFGSPDIEADLQQFDQAMGLPDANFSQIAPAGAPPAFDPNDDNQVGWGIETTLDVEWAHADRTRGQHRARGRAEQQRHRHLQRAEVRHPAQRRRRPLAELR